VREVDWCNRVYEDDGAGKLLVGGMFEEHVWTCNLTGTSEDFGGHTTERLELDAVAYGDLDQDGIEDAVVTLASDWLGCGDLRAGGRGLTRTSTIQAFTVRDGAVVPIAKKLWAHRVPSPSLAIADGEVQRTYLLENGHDCVERWRLSSEALTPVASCRL
jgi:hypothetical protein